MNTLLLDQTAWDLVLDSNGNIAMAEAPYSRSQDVVTACKLHKGEHIYQTDKGVPWFSEIIGQLPPASLICGYLEQAALTVDGVISPQCVLTDFENRSLTGQLVYSDIDGVAGVITL